MTVLLPALLAACVPHLTSPPDTGPDEWIAPENSWPTASPPEDLEATGTGDGEVPPDFRMTDQFGDTVALWQFYGLVVVVDISTMWCAPCQDLAGHVEATWQAYREEGFVYVTVLAQDLGSDPPEVDELTSWADYYGITAPVLSDAEAWSFPITGTDGFPRVIVIDREMRIVEDEVVPTDDATIRSLVETLL